MTTAHFDLAQAVLEGKALKAGNQFATARRVLDKAIASPASTESGDAEARRFATWLQQQRALCTYKDAERPPLNRLREALGILRCIGLFDPATVDAEMGGGQMTASGRLVQQVLKSFAPP